MTAGLYEGATFYFMLTIPPTYPFHGEIDTQHYTKLHCTAKPRYALPLCFLPAPGDGGSIDSFYESVIFLGQLHWSTLGSTGVPRATCRGYTN